MHTNSAALTEPGRHRRETFLTQASRRLGSVWARLTLVAFLGLFSLLGLQNYDASAETTTASAPTVRFNGALNVLGILNGVNVSPSQVQVHAGGEVIIANDAGTQLTVTVGAQTFSLPSGQSRAVHFSGSSTEQAVPVRATALNLPVIGNITSSTSVVNVGPKHATPEENSNTPSPNSGGSPPSDHTQKNGSTSNESDGSADDASPTTDPTPTPTGEVDVTAGGISALSSNSRTATDERAISTLGDERGSTGTNPMSGNAGLLVAVVTVVMIGVGAAGVRVLVGYRALLRFR